MGRKLIGSGCKNANIVAESTTPILSPHLADKQFKSTPLKNISSKKGAATATSSNSASRSSQPPVSRSRGITGFRGVLISLSSSCEISPASARSGRAEIYPLIPQTTSLQAFRLWRSIESQFQPARVSLCHKYKRDSKPANI